MAIGDYQKEKLHELILKPRTGTSDPDTMQIRAMAKRAGMPTRKFIGELKRGGMQTRGFNDLTKVNILDAFAALGIHPNADPTETPDRATQEAMGAPTLEEAAKLASARLAAVKTGEPTGTTGTGNEDDDPVPPALLSGEYRDVSQFFPMPRKENQRPDLFYWFVNQAPSKVQYNIQNGWRYVHSPAHFKQLYPDGRWKKMLDAFGHLVFKDTVLMCLPRIVWDRRKAEQRAEASTRLAAVADSYEAAIDDARRGLRKKLGAGGDRAIQPVRMSAEEAGERAAFSRRGSTTARVFVKR